MIKIIEKFANLALSLVYSIVLGVYLELSEGSEIDGALITIFSIGLNRHFCYITKHKGYSLVNHLRKGFYKKKC